LDLKGKLDLHIEELVLYGFPQGDRRIIASAVESELTRLLGEAGAFEALKARDGAERIDAGAFELTSDHRSGVVGGQVAGAVYRGLVR
jgi:hypothetical protein